MTLTTYLSDISSMNFMQIWLFPMPPIPQRRQEHLPVARAKKMFPSLSSTSFRPVKNGLEFGRRSTGIVSPSAEKMLTTWVSHSICTIITIITKFFIQPTRKTYKSAVGDEYILSIRKTIQSGMLIPLISKSQETLLEATDRGIIWYSIMRGR